MAKSKTIDPMPKHQLEEMHTGSLLKRLERLRALNESFQKSDWTDQERLESNHVIAFKDTDLWAKAWTDVKDVLSRREHIKRGHKKPEGRAMKPPS
jgi:hypothetical protein